MILDIYRLTVFTVTVIFVFLLLLVFTRFKSIKEFKSRNEIIISLMKYISIQCIFVK